MARAKRRQTLRSSHRWLGLGLALPLVALSLTGILLNHTDALRLDSRYAAQDWILSLYGVHPSVPERGYQVGTQWISRARETLLLDARKLAHSQAPLVGADTLGPLLVIAEPTHISLFTQAGQLVDRVRLPQAFTPIRDLAVADQQLLLQSTAGIHAGNADLIDWAPYSDPWPGGNRTQALPPELRADISAYLSAHTLTWEKIVLDLHSGRLFGPLGPWLLDALALIITILAITGCTLWLRGRQRQQKRP